MNDPSSRMNSSLEEVNALYQRLLELEQSNQQYQEQIEQLTQQLAQEKAARQQAEEQLQITLVSAQMVAWDMDLIANRIVCSPNALEVWGIEEGTKEAFFSLIHPDDRQQVMQAWECAIAGETDYLQEYRVMCPEGAICWLNSRGRVYRDATGRGVRVVGLSVDVTDRKQAELQLQESQRFIQQIAAAMPGTLYVYDVLEQRNVYVNRQIGELLGYTPEQIQSLGDQLFAQLIHPDDFATIGTQFERLDQVKDGESVDYEYRMQHADGTWRWLWSRNTVSTRTPDGRTHQVVGTVHDITDRKRAEAELQQREQEFRTLVENTPDIIVRYDRALHHLYINPSIEQALGIPPEQFIGKTGLELGFTDEFSQRWYATLQQVFETGQGYSMEYEFPNPQGEVRFYQAQFVPELTEGEHVKTVVGVARDVTEYKRTELSLRQSEERLRLAMEGAQMATWDVDLHTGKAIWSEQHFTMLGYEPVATGEASEQMWSRQIHPDDIDRVIQVWQQARLDHTLYQAEYRVIRADNGQIAWLAGLGSFTYDASGTAVRSIGILLDITARKQAEAALAESNQTLEAIIQACPLAIMGLRADGTVRIWNPAAERIFGWSQQEVLGKFLPAIPDDNRDEFLKNLAGTIQEQGLTAIEAQRQKKGNILFDVELWTAPVDEAQAGISCVSVVADITARKRTEAALRLNEERLHSFVTANVIGILFGDLEGGIQEANDEFLRIVGYTREDLNAGNLRWIDITPPEYLPFDEAAIIEARKRGACTPYEKEYIRKDGSRVPVFVGFGLVLAGREEAVAFILDLSDRKQAEESLRQSEERLRLALLVGKSGIWDWDIVNNHITWSEQIYQFHGLTPETFSGKVEDFAKLIHPEDWTSMSDAIRDALAAGSSYEIEFRAVQPTGTIRWLSTTGGVIFDQQGNPVRMLGATIDITERKAIEAEREQLLKREQAAREQAEAANRVKDEFLAVLSHELRTPLTPILGWIKLLRTRQFDAAATDRALETIERNAKLQSQLIEDLLDVSRILQGKVRLDARPVNLVSIIEAALETVQLSAEAKGIHIQTFLDSEVSLVNGDANRLQQVLWNLLSNAVKFTQAGDRVEVRLEQRGTSVQVQVSDTGQGISPEFLPHVFEYFRQADSSTTRQFGGLGLGLAIVHHLVELHGGTVKAESAGHGMGATFTVQLPLMVTAFRPDAETWFTPPSQNLHGVDILVVDDEADMRNLLRFILEEQGATVRLAASAVEALQQVSESVPDLLISDIGMPGLDGYALIRQIRALPEQGQMIPAIALTAYAGEVNQQQALAAGFQLHMAKPIDPQQFVKGVVEIMAQSFKPSS